MKRAAVPLLAVLAVLAMLSTARAAAPPGLATYRAAVHAARIQLDAIARTPSPAAGTRDAVVIRLQRLAHVRLPDGRVVATDLPALAAGVAHGPARSVAAAAAELDRIDDALSGADYTAPTRSNLASLDDVLRDSRFHPSENPLQRLLDWIGQQINRLLDAIARFLQSLLPGGPSASLPTFLFAVIFLVIVAAAAVLVARAVLRRTVVAPADRDEEDEPRTSVAADERVGQYLAAGNFRLALRYLLLSTLLQLQDLRVLRLRPGVTNREYLRALERDLAGNAGIAGPMGEVIEVFDRTWYGHMPIDRSEYERCRELAAMAVGAAERAGAA